MVTGAGSTDEPLRVVIADDHPMVRFGVTAVLESVPDVVVVGEAADGQELLTVAAATHPHVVLTDLGMGEHSGLAAIRHLTSEPDGPAVLVLTMHADDEAVTGALRAGARGYLIKGAGRDELVRAVRGVAAGDVVYGAGVAARVLDLLSSPQQAAEDAAFPELTGRERCVLDLLANGLRNHAIAVELGLSEKTVRNHLSSIFAKLGVPDRTAAALLARSTGLGQG